MIRDFDAGGREDLLAQIYEAALLPEQWPVLLDRIAQAVRARGGTVGRHCDRTPLMIVSPGIADPAAGWVERGYHLDNRRARPLVERDHAGFLTDFDLHDAEARRGMACYRDFLIPERIDLGTGTAMTDAEGRRLIVTIEGFADADAMMAAVPWLDTLRPHLARAAMLGARLELRACAAATEALARIGMPAAMLHADGRVQAANPAFVRELGHHLFDARDRLRLADRVADAALVEALTTLGRHPAGAFVRLHGRTGGDFTALHLFPVTGAARDLFAQTAAIAVLVGPAGRHLPAPALVQALYDLTPTEAQVACAIAAGIGLRDIAHRGNKSYETVRSHLKRVYSKTGTRHQSELAALLAGPAFRPDMPLGMPVT